MLVKRNRRLLLGTAAVSCIVFGASIHDFLAVNSPVRSGLLVVEGWVPRWALDHVPPLIATGHYSQMVFVEYPNMLTLDEETLSDGRSLRRELDKTEIAIVAVKSVPLGHQTYSGARAVKVWLTTEKKSIRKADVFTVGVHARKSRLLYREALGDDIDVGVIAAKPCDYDPKLWFVSPRGIWLVTRNVAGYAYSLGWAYSRRLCCTK